MKKIFLFILTVVNMDVFAQVNIVPMPVSASVQTNVTTKFKINNSTIISYNDILLKKDVDNFIDKIKITFGVSLTSKFDKVAFNKKHKIENNKIVVTLLSKNYRNEQGNEYYNIFGGTSSMQIIVNHPQGFFYAIQTLNQLLKKNNQQKLELPLLNINDYPRFTYRGMHLDVSRHFFPITFIKKYIDLLAMHKYNTFHWHLTDDQGWRIEIKKYPLLTQIGGYRNGTIIGRYPGTGNDGIRYGGYYTQEEIKEIVQYATERYITVIPEIEMPGHASAAIAAYPQLSCFPEENTALDSTTSWAGSRVGKQVQQTWGVFNDVFAPTDYTFNFIENVLDEVMALFPSKYIHIGGDECPKENWKRSPSCQQIIKDNNLKDEHGLQSYFIQRIEKYVNSKGKKIIGWDEILEGGLAPNAAVMSWRGTEGGTAAAKQQHNVIMTPGSHCYFDHSQTNNEDSVTIGSYLPLEKVYAYEPIPASLSADEAKYILGAQGNVWTEYMTNESKVEYMVLPRIAALAEVLWSDKGKTNFENFEKRLPLILERYKAMHYNYSTAFYDLKSVVMKLPNNKVAWSLATKNKNAIILTKVNGGVTKNYNGPVTINETGEYEAATIDKTGSINSKWIKQTFSINKASGKLITLKNDPNISYNSGGAFSLVDGIQNTRGMAKSQEFLGFLGKDLEAIIDLGEPTDISEIILHTFTRKASWIYPPKENSIKLLVSDDGINFTQPLDEIITSTGNSNITNRISISTSKKIITTRYIKIIAGNFGIIPNGYPGAGNAAWLFADEIEVL